MYNHLLKSEKSDQMQGDTLAPYFFIICWDYVLETSIDLIKENGFTVKKNKKQTIFYRVYDTQTAQMI